MTPDSAKARHIHLDAHAELSLQHAKTLDFEEWFFGHLPARPRDFLNDLSL